MRSEWQNAPGASVNTQQSVKVGFCFPRLPVWRFISQPCVRDAHACAESQLASSSRRWSEDARSSGPCLTWGHTECVLYLEPIKGTFHLKIKIITSRLNPEYNPSARTRLVSLVSLVFGIVQELQRSIPLPVPYDSIIAHTTVSESKLLMQVLNPILMK